MFCAVRRLLTITLPRLFASQSWLEVTGNIYWSWWHIVRHKTSGRVSNAWTGPILLVRHNNVEGKYWWHCWNRNGLGPSPRLWRSGHKPAENCVKIENDTKFGLWSPAPAPHWPPIPVTMVTNCHDPNIWYKHSRRNEAALLSWMVICLGIDCFSEVRICRRQLSSVSLSSLWYIARFTASDRWCDVFNLDSLFRAFWNPRLGQ